MNPIKKLAGQTALYGVSTIAGRILNYLLVPLHSWVFMLEEFGKINDLYAYVAFLNIIYTYGMETAFFRYSSSKKNTGNANAIYQQALGMVMVTSLVFSSILFWQSQAIANYLEYPDSAYIVKWLAFIVLIDAVVAIPFAKLRQENKALKFTIAKLSAIGITVLLNVLFLMVLPALSQEISIIDRIYNPDLGVGYVFLANLLGNATLPLILAKQLFPLRFPFHWPTMRSMALYGFPIFIAGFTGMINERIDIILFTDLLPQGFYDNKSNLAALGAYSASVKLSIFMLLAIQAFRYAGEPFFFNSAEDKNAKTLFADVFHYFVIFSIIIFTVISFNVDLLGKIFLSKPSYRSALYLVPFLLMAKLFFGIYINLSIWFKLTDKTSYGMLISGIGAIITLLGNILLVPVIGYLGCALASLCCYSVMSIICFYLGKKYYPVPYRIKPLFIYLMASTFLVYLHFQIPHFQGKDIFNIFLALLFTLVVWKIEKNKLRGKFVNL